MAPGTPKRREVKHHTHKHALTEVNGIGQFTCDGCYMYGSGKTYRCFGCNFDLHEFCATCPSRFRASAHPQHELVRADKPTSQSQRVCDVCHVAVLGMSYRCESCGFHAHPLCTTLHPLPPPPSEGQPSSPYGPYHHGPYGPYPHGVDHDHHRYVKPGQGESPRRSKGKGIFRMAASLTAAVVANVVGGAVLGEMAGTPEQ